MKDKPKCSQFLRELIKTDFSTSAFPVGWALDRANHTFKDGKLWSGAGTQIHFMLPGGGWNHLRIDVLANSKTGLLVGCGDGITSAYADIARSEFKILYAGKCELGRTNLEPFLSQDEPLLISFDFNRGQIAISVNQHEVLTVSEPPTVPYSGIFRLEFWDDCEIHEVSVHGGDEDPSFGVGMVRKPKDDFFLEVNVDFTDDLVQAPFTVDMFDQLFAEFKSWGVSRCHWIYYGGKKDGWWDNAAYGVHPHAMKTYENVGDIFTTAVNAAHRHGIKIYGMMKPFDMIGSKYSLGESDPDAPSKGKLQRIGGPAYWIANFPAIHRELCMSRKPSAFGSCGKEAFTRIDLVKEDDRNIPFSANDLKLYVSDDNTTYREYEGSIEKQEVIEDYPLWEHTSSGGGMTGRKRRSRVLRLKNLNIREKYFVIKTEGKAHSFSNTWINLIHVFGEQKEERLLTYGVQSRYDATIKDGEVIVTKEDFRKKGVEFDQLPGTPTAIFPGYDAVSARFTFDANDGMLAVARGKDRDPTAALSPSFPEAHDWWLSWVQNMLEAGCDGVEMRVRNHASLFAWAEYGFEKPVRDEFLERHGVDLWKTDDFDKAAWRRLRGEGYTEFYRKVKKMTDAHGKPLGIHISPTFLMEPETGSAMEIHWDWKTWLKEGIPESLTLKEVWPFTRFETEILECIKGKKIETIFCPYANNLWRTPGGERQVKAWIDLARKAGHSGYQFYECSAVVKASPDGRITMTQPALKELFKKEFVR